MLRINWLQSMGVGLKVQRARVMQVQSVLKLIASFSCIHQLEMRNQRSSRGTEENISNAFLMSSRDCFQNNPISCISDERGGCSEDYARIVGGAFLLGSTEQDRGIAACPCYGIWVAVLPSHKIQEEKKTNCDSIQLMLKHALKGSCVDDRSIICMAQLRRAGFYLQATAYYSIDKALYFQSQNHLAVTWSPSECSFVFAQHSHKPLCSSNKKLCLCPVAEAHSALFPYLSILLLLFCLPPQSSHCSCNSPGRMELLISKPIAVCLYHTSVPCNNGTSLSPHGLLSSPKATENCPRLWSYFCVSYRVDSFFFLMKNKFIT